MSFILQLFHGPAVRSVADAAAHVEREQPASPDDEKRFAAFVADITRAYPNPDDDDETDSAWPEGLGSAGFSRSTYNFAVSLDHLDDNLMAHVGHAAARAQLKVLDPQSGLLYPVEGRVVDMRGDSSPLPQPQPVTPPPPKGLPPGFDDEKAVNAKLATQLATMLAPYGFALDPSGLVARDLGRVKQGLDIGTMKRDREMVLYLRLVFYSPEIRTHWEELLGEPVAAFVKQGVAWPRYAYDFHLSASELRRPPSAAAKRLGTHAYEDAHNWDEAHAWLRHVVSWLEDEGLADLDRMKDPAGLAHFVLNETQQEMMFGRNNLLPRELFARMILMGTFAADLRDEWLRGYWDHYDRSGLRFHSSPLPGFKHLSEKMIEWLATEEFARVAESLVGAEERG